MLSSDIGIHQVATILSALLALFNGLNSAAAWRISILRRVKITPHVA